MVKVMIAASLMLVSLLALPGRMVADKTSPWWALAASSENHLSPEIRAAFLDSNRTVIHQSALLASNADWRDFSKQTAAVRFTCFADVDGDCSAGPSFSSVAELCPGQQCPLPSNVKVVAYDDERWDCAQSATTCVTPLREQREAGVYMKAFCQLAHSKGWKCMLEPSQDLVVNDDSCSPTHTASGFATYPAEYLDCVPQQVAQAHPDFYVIQAQTLESAPGDTESDCAPEYKRFVTTARNIVSRTAPSVTVLTALNPDTTSFSTSATVLVSCWNSVYPAEVAGAYLTITSLGGPTFDAFFDDLHLGATRPLRRASVSREAGRKEPSGFCEYRESGSTPLPSGTRGNSAVGIGDPAFVQVMEAAASPRALRGRRPPNVFPS